MGTCTAKQEKFAQNIVSGMTQADAYRNAYDCAGMNDNSIYVTACRLLDNSKVALRIKELRQELSLEHRISRERQLKVLQSIIDANYSKTAQGLQLTDKESRNLMLAIQEQNKLLGLYAPVKTENKTQVTLGDDFDKLVDGMLTGHKIKTKK